ncbi:type-1 angiotensin II receptor-like [Ruditapes philippinarum]|uniref:type-1 angiotensin II receptor-like n=1 Tax=Ruditapes philippinarum TaxID=129788 RepID=UPI00295BC9AA|nr:type-1 angiotensin II receptor-like [Ruditapes philippinarum]
MDSNQHKGSDIARMIWIVGSPIIFTIGVFGNLMTIIVLNGKRNKYTSSTVFLTFLAVADLIMMAIMLPRWWLIYLFGFDVRHIHNIICKIQFFSTYFGSGWSASLLAAVTIERTICTVKPYRVKTICSVQVAVITSLFLALTLFVIHGHVLVGINLHEIIYNEAYQTKTSSSMNDSIKLSANTCESMLDMLFDTERSMLINTLMLEEDCGSSDASRIDDSFVNKISNDELNDVRMIKVCWYDDLRYGQYFSGIHQIVASICYLIIPETIFFVGGLIIARSLHKSKIMRKGMRTKFMRTSGFKPAFDSRATQITLTLILVNIVFVCTTSPAYIFLMGRSSWVDEDTGMTTTQEIIWAVVNMMIYINHSINFVLYFLSGYRFRRQVLETFGCLKSPDVVNGMGVCTKKRRTASVSHTDDSNFK